VTIGSNGGWRPLTGLAGSVLPASELKFALDVKQAGFDRGGTMKSPQEAYQPMNEFKLDQCSRVNTAYESALERSVGSNIFDSLNHGLISKPITPSAAP
jgi:hypothetical protein